MSNATTGILGFDSEGRNLIEKWRLWILSKRRSENKGTSQCEPFGQLVSSTKRESAHEFFGAVHHDAQKNEQHVIYDFDGRVVQTVRTALPQPWDAGSTLTSCVVYGPFGHIKAATDAGGNHTQMLYDN